jgi:hypothetical protein
MAWWARKHLYLRRTETALATQKREALEINQLGKHDVRSQYEAQQCYGLKPGCQPRVEVSEERALTRA